MRGARQAGRSAAGPGACGGRARVLALGLGVALALTSCSAIGGSDQEAESSDTVVLITHDSFALSQETLDSFTAETGLRLEHRTNGDAGALATSLVLAQDDPIGDVVYGIDNAFASRAVDEGVFADYVSPAASGRVRQLDYPGSSALTPIDYGDVCINIDTRYFAERGLAEPEDFADLGKPEYRGLTVVENPATSSPGLAFLLATIAIFGDNGWQSYWETLKANDVAVVDSWSQAYYVDFSGSEGNGPKPIVVSYASSPPAEAPADGSPPPTKALEASCFRQIEYAGVLEGARNPEGARKVIDFLLSARVQAELPSQMYVFPVIEGVQLPENFMKYAPRPSSPITMEPSKIGENRDEWIAQWRELMQG
jgi:thiamine transport system substrate-binding protein